MMVRIGIRESVKELEVELPDDTDREALKSRVEELLLGAESAMLWLTDRHGREVGVPSERVSYVDMGQSGSGPKIGFGA